MRQKIQRSRSVRFRRRNPAMRYLVWGIVAVIIVATGFFGAKLFAERPSVDPASSSSLPAESSDTVSETSQTQETSAPSVTPTGTNAYKGFYIPTSMLTDTAKLSETLNKAAAAGFGSVVFDMKDVDGTLWFRSTNEQAIQVNAFAVNALSTEKLKEVFTIIRNAGLKSFPRVFAFRDNAAARTLADARISHVKNAGWVWYDADPQNGGKAWLNPYSESAHLYIIRLCNELKEAGADGIMLDGVQFPVQTASASYGATADLTKTHDQVLTEFVEQIRTHLGKAYPVILTCTDARVAGNKVTINNTNLLTYTSSAAAPTVFPDDLGPTVIVGDQALQNTAETTAETVKAIVNQMALRIKVLPTDSQPVLAPMLQAYNCTAEQIAQEITGCQLGGAVGYFLYNPDGSYDFNSSGSVSATAY